MLRKREIQDFLMPVYEMSSLKHSENSGEPSGITHSNPVMINNKFLKTTVTKEMKKWHELFRSYQSAALLKCVQLIKSYQGLFIGTD